jgi:hypothetical protein
LIVEKPFDYTPRKTLVVPLTIVPMLFGRAEIN